MIVGHILFDGVNHALGRKLSRLNGDGPGAGAYVPDNARRLQIELGQGNGPHLRPRDQPTLGLALSESIIRVAETSEATAGRLLIRPAFLALEDHDVERCELHFLNIGQLALRDAFVRRAQVFAYEDSEIIQPAG